MALGRLSLLSIIFGIGVLFLLSLLFRLGWERLQELSWLWLLISSRLCYLQLVPRKSDLDSASNVGLLHNLFLTCVLVLGLDFSLASVGDELVLLVEEWETSLDDLGGDKNFGDFHLESIESNLPVTLDFSDGVVDDLANSGGS